MSHRRLTVTLLAAAVLSACQSHPSAPQAPAAEAAAASAADAYVADAATRAARADVARRERASLESIVVTGQRARAQQAKAAAAPGYAYAPPPPPAPAMMEYRTAHLAAGAPMPPQAQPANTEKYAERDDNPVRRTLDEPVSTFSVDVDTGSYSNVRRMLREGERPPANAVRAEEFINYFRYGHAAPTDRSRPFQVSTELASAPWNAKRQLLMIGIKGYDVPKATLPPANLVFLMDTSGSMDSPDKLPLLKQSFAQLVPQLRAQDRVSVVVYAGSAGLVLPPTPGDRHDEILSSLDRLQAGGSTNGGDGIRLAYAMAKQAFIKDGVNRVILATDGDFNVGTVSQDALETMVGDQRKSGIALTTLGFGAGNYNDALAERLADVGDGNHAYIDTLQEGRKVLVDEMQSTLLTIARDVKIQVEFNPAVVAEYRLIGYENRVLANEDFANDKVDAGDIGAGHEVTALYEITPAGAGAERLPALRYGGKQVAADASTDEVAHVRLRYKLPGQDTSRLIEAPIARTSLTTQPSNAFRFASAVAAYADLLRGGQRIDGWNWNDVARTARSATGRDPYGLKTEFVDLIEQAHRLVVAQDNGPVIAGE